MPPHPSSTFEANLELVLLGRPPHDVHLQAGPAAGIRVGTDHHQMAVGELDPELSLVGSHDGAHDGPATKGGQRVRDAPKLLERDLGHRGVRGRRRVGKLRPAGPTVFKSVQNATATRSRVAVRCREPLAQSSTTIRYFEGAQNSSGDSI